MKNKRKEVCERYKKEFLPFDKEFILFHTFASHVMDQKQDPMKAAQFLVDRGLFNGIMIWVDHHKRPIKPPSVKWLKHHDLSIFFEFYTNDHYAVPQAQMEGFGNDLTAYNEWWCQLILNYMKEMGSGDSYWGLGHEHYDSFELFPEITEEGKVNMIHPSSRKNGFKRYYRWVTTNEHQLHWGPHRYQQTSQSFKIGAMTNQVDTLEFLRQRDLAIPHGLVIGGVLPQNAHYQFEIFPEQEGFWWECMHSSSCAVQVGMSFLRGATVQYARKILTDVAPYARWRSYHKDLERDGPVAWGVPASPYYTIYDDKGQRLAGYSESMHLRTWMSLWVGGVNQMLHEDSIATHFLAQGRILELSPLGKAHALLAELSLRRGRDRGEVIRTAGVMLPFLHGLCPPVAPGIQPWPDSRRPWHGLEPTPGDWSIARFFDTAFPGHGIQPKYPYPFYPDTADLKGRKHYGKITRMSLDFRVLEEHHVTSSRWGDGLDVILDNASTEILRCYPALIFLGDFEEDSPISSQLLKYVKEGGCALVSSDFPGLKKIGFTLGQVTKGEESIIFENKPPQPEKLPYNIRFVSPPDKAKLLAWDAKDNPILWEMHLGNGSLWVVCVDHLVGDKPSNPPYFPDFVLCIIDRFLEPHIPLKVYGPPIQWCISKNKQGLRLYVANHNAYDILPVLRVLLEVLDITIAENFIGRELVKDQEIPLTVRDGELEIELPLRAYEFNLLDIPAKQVQPLAKRDRKLCKKGKPNS